MKKNLISLLLPYHLITTAQVAKSNTDFIRTGAFERKIANLGPGCRIKMDIPRGAKFGQGYQSTQSRGRAGFSIEMPPNFSNSGRWGFDFSCYHTTEKEFQKAWKYRSPQGDINLKIESGRETYVDEDDTNYTRIKSKNSEGWALTFDDTTGEERFRQRHLRYCIKAKDSAICGSSDIGYIDFLSKKNNIDIASYAFKILESMEFLEDLPPD